MSFLEFEKKIGIKFNNVDLLKQAFTHRSYLNENPKWDVEHNERLEFLGDAVLELIVTEFLYKKFPDKNEGEMTSFRAALVNTNTLAELAEDLSMDTFLLLSKGEKKGPARARLSLLANSVEAVIGAVYLDQDYGVARKFLKENLFPKLDKVIEEKLWIDSKSLFQEKAQDVESITPSYKVIEEHGPDHEKHFVVGVYLGEELVAQGDGLSKQDAEQEAARSGLKVKKWN